MIMDLKNQQPKRVKSILFIVVQAKSKRLVEVFSSFGFGCTLDKISNWINGQDLFYLCLFLIVQNNKRTRFILFMFISNRAKQQTDKIYFIYI
jgi:hypothetical protein